MNIFKVILKEHDRHRATALSISECKADYERRHALWREFRDDIQAHANAEEQTLYAELIGDKEAQPQSRHCIVEHQRINDLVDDLDGRDPEDEDWHIVFETLRDRVEHHMREEEDEILPLAQSLIDEDRATSLSVEFEKKKGIEKRQ